MGVAATVDRAICLRKLDYSETSQILAIFTRGHGLLRVIAKGAKRSTKAGDSRFSGGLDLLEVGEAVFLHWPEKEMSQLTEWTLEEGHLGLRESLRAMYLGQYAAELVGTLFEEHDAHPAVFDDLEGLVRVLAGGGGGSGGKMGVEEAGLAFQLRVLESAGILPELGMCTGCGRVGSGGYFSPGRGGVVCGECERVYPDRVVLHESLARLGVRVLGLGREVGGGRVEFGRMRLPKLTRLQTDPLNRVLLAHVAQVTGRFPRMGEFVMAKEGFGGGVKAVGVSVEEPWMPALPRRPLEPEEIAAIEEERRKAEEKAAKAAAPRKPRKKKPIIISPDGIIGEEGAAEGAKPTDAEAGDGRAEAGA